MRVPGISLLLLLGIGLCAQDQGVRRCGTNHIPANARTIEAPISTHRQSIEIPIVFHIIYNADEENIPDETIISQLQMINQDYSSIDPLTRELPKSFNKKVAAPGISFCLAQTDPFGQPSDGIVRIPTQTSFVGSQSQTVEGERRIKDSELGGSSAWDTDRYLNVWIGARDDGIAGDATFPEDPDETESDGIVLDYKVVGIRSSTDGPFNLGRTLTHEIGHYLNVFHLYGAETGCFNDDDLVADTPNQFGPYFGSCQEGVSSCGSRDMDTNFMNFRDDSCLYYFTKGQVDRMIQTLFTSRYQLISSETCSAGKPIPPDPLSVAPIVTLPNGLEIPLVTLSEQTYTLSLFDMSGRLVWHSASNAEHRYLIDNGGLSTNIYILMLELEDDHFTRKVFLR